MAKSVNKRILVIFIAIFTAVFALSFVRFSYVKADEEIEEPKSAEERIEDLCAAVEELYEYLRDNDVEIDEGSFELKYSCNQISEANNEGKDVEDYLSGDIGLSGIKGIAELAVEFYDEYIGGYNSYCEYKLSDAKSYIEGFAINLYRKSNYDSAEAQTYYDEFNAPASDTDKYASYKDDLQKVYDRYLQDEHSDYVNYVRRKLPDVDRKLNDAKSALDDCKDDAEANRIVSNFNAEFNNVYSYLQYLKYEVVDTAYNNFKNAYTSQYTSIQRELNYAFEAMEACENAIDYYCAVLVQNPDNGEAKNMASAVLGTYKDHLCLEAIKVVVEKRAPDYGPSALEKINANRKIAEEIIRSITSEGKIASPYTYWKSSDTYLVNKANDYISVERGSDVVQAFDDSYEDYGALKINGKTSSVPAARSSTIVGNCDGFKITITSYEADGITEAKEFDLSTTRIEVRQGTTPSVKRNINTILNGNNLIDKISRSVPNRDAIADELKGKHLHYYFTIKIYESNVERNDFNGNYRVKIEILGDNTAAQYKDNLNVINYYHTQIIGAVAKDKITMDGSVIMFYTDSFSQFALLSNIAWTDIALWALIGIIALIAILWLIVLIVYLVKNRKFKIVFNANGGEPTKCLKVKHKEKFSYPANPVRDGYVFMGWYTSAELETRFASTEMLNKENITVWAKWITLEEYEALKAAEQANEDDEEVVSEELVAATVAAVEDSAFDLATIFAKVKAEAASYVKADDLPYGLDIDKTICKIRLTSDAVKLEVDMCGKALGAKGYTVEKGETLTSEFAVRSEDELSDAFELIEEVMAENGYIKGEAKEPDDNTDEFEFKVHNDRLAETADELLKVLRVKVGSYALCEGEFKEDKSLAKMFIAQGKLSIYLNYIADGLFECDEALKAEGYKSFTIVHNAEEAKAVLAHIKAMMAENGLNVSLTVKNISEEESDKGFNFTLKK